MTDKTERVLNACLNERKYIRWEGRNQKIAGPVVAAAAVDYMELNGIYGYSIEQVLLRVMMTLRHERDVKHNFTEVMKLSAFAANM